MNEREYEDLIARMREQGPHERARRVTYQAFTDIVKEFKIPEDRAKSIVLALYHLGWHDALVFFGEGGATYPDGTPLIAPDVHARNSGFSSGFSLN